MSHYYCLFSDLSFTGLGIFLASLLRAPIMLREYQASAEGHMAVIQFGIDLCGWFGLYLMSCVISMVCMWKHEIEPVRIRLLRWPLHKHFVWGPLSFACGYGSLALAFRTIRLGAVT